MTIACRPVSTVSVAAIVGALLAACGGGGGGADSSQDGASNQAPSAVALAPAIVSAGRSVTLDGSNSSDPDRDALSYAWTVIEQPAGSTAVVSNADAPIASIVPDLPGRYVIALNVGDGRLVGTPAIVVVDARAGNAPPIADAGPSRSVRVGETVTLSAALSTDAEGDPMRFDWALTLRPAGSAAVLSGPQGATPSFVADVAGIYEAVLVASDAGGSGPPSRTRVTAVPSSTNLPPVADAGLDNTTVVGRPLTLDGSRSTDPEGGPLSFAWSLTGRPAGSAASLQGAEGALPVLQPDVPGQYVATLVVRDDAGKDAQDAVVITAIANASLPTSAFIRAGGGSVTTAAGRVYEADRYFIGGRDAQRSRLVSGTLDDPLYQNERWGEFGYAIPLADGEYHLTLHFAERYPGITGSGQRVFDLRIEPDEVGAQTLADIDIRATVGPDAAWDVERTVSVRGGALDLRFVPKRDNATLQGIAIVPTAQATPGPVRTRTLARKALRLLQGRSAIRCAAVDTVVELSEAGLTIGGTLHPAEALASISLSAGSLRGGLATLHASLVVQPGPSATSVDLDWGTDGRLAAATVGGTPCTPLPVGDGGGRWGTLDGRAKALLDAVEKPLPAYPTQSMTCTRAGMFVPPTTSVLRIESGDFVMTGTSATPGSAPEWRRTTWANPDGIEDAVETYLLDIRTDRLVTSYGFTFTDAIALGHQPDRTLTDLRADRYKGPVYECTR